jgi:hypothetical protein
VRKGRKVIGWREWVALPDLGVAAIKAKVDTGARTSSLHAFAVEEFRAKGRDMVRFEIHPRQRSRRGTVTVEAEVLDVRSVKSSTGHRQRRLVIETDVVLLGERWPIEITLASRDAMGFRMLLGRQALRGRFQVDPGRSFLGRSRSRN